MHVLLRDALSIESAIAMLMLSVCPSICLSLCMMIMIMYIGWATSKVNTRIIVIKSLLCGVADLLLRQSSPRATAPFFSENVCYLNTSILVPIMPYRYSASPWLAMRDCE